MHIILSKLLSIVKKCQSSMFLGICIMLIAIISFNLGKINALHQVPIKISEGANIYKAISGNTSQTTVQKGISATPKPQQPADMRVVASKNSNPKKYHFTWCSGAKRIKLENQIWFNSAAEAEKAGFVLAGNCTP